MRKRRDEGAVTYFLCEGIDHLYVSENVFGKLFENLQSCRTGCECRALFDHSPLISTESDTFYSRALRNSRNFFRGSSILPACGKYYFPLNSREIEWQSTGWTIWMVWVC